MENKYILVLGATGFLGKNIINILNLESYTPNTRFILVGSDFSNIKDRDFFIKIQLNYKSSVDLETIFIQYKISEVFHFISTSVPSTSNNDFVSDIEMNLIFTIKLLNLMKKFNVSKIYYLSSGGTIYGDLKYKNFQEDEVTYLNSSYAIMKRTIENYIYLFNRLHGIKYVILRISNPFGFFHKNNNNGIINISIRNILNSNTINIWGNGKDKRDFIFASDLANIFWQIYNQNLENHVLNVGSGKQYSINDIIQILKNINNNFKYEYNDTKSFLSNNQEFNIRKLQSILKFDYTEIDKAVKLTYAWEFNNIKKK